MKSTSRSRTRVSRIFDLQPLEIRRFLTTATLSSGTLTITGTGSGETITVNKPNSTQVSVTGVSTLFNFSSITRIVINAQGGNDTITISGNLGSNIPSQINAGDGNDVIATGLGDDEIFGQNGFDTVNYSARTNRITVRMDGLANDGETQNGEADNVNAEEVLGGAGADVFYGNDSANFFGGGSGNDEMAAAGGADELVGGTGNDKLYGEGGDDALYAKNNDTDTVNGGTGPSNPDLDLAEVDAADVASSVSSAALIAARNAALAAAAAVNPAALDPTYGNETTPGQNTGGLDGFNWDRVTAATVDSQGRTILVGYAGNGYDSDFVALRYDADGNFDDTFAGDGQAEIDFSGGDDRAFGVTTDADDNIIIVGESGGDFAVCRLDNTGATDTDFGAQVYDAGGDADSAADVTIDDLGNIIVVGTMSPDEGDTDIAVLRLESDGDLDLTFNGTGLNVLAAPGDQQASAIVMDELLGGIDKGILVGGTSDGDFFLARFTLQGTLDTSFGDNAGYSTFSFSETAVDELNDLMVNPVTGQIVAVGQTSPEIIITVASPVPAGNASGAILSVDADGSSNVDYATYGIPDQGISFNAIVYDPWNSGFAIVGATSSGFDEFEGFIDGDFVVAKFDDAHTFAPGFEGLLTTDFSPSEGNWNDVALGLGLVNGKIIVGGYSDTDLEGSVLTSVARYNVGTGAKDVEGEKSFADVQNDRGANRSATATFYLKSSHLDDNGNATITLTNNNDVVNIDVLGNQVRVNANGIVLYYDLNTTSITINCLNGDDVVTATNDVLVPLFILGGNGVDNLSGGGAGDVIVGGAGSDTTNGNNGNDILLGGASGDTQNGGGGEDIFVGGTTSYDDNLTALKALRAEWNSGASNAIRISHIRGTTSGGLNGAFRLKVGSGATVFDDSSKDTYTGGNDRDWFFRRITGGTGSRDVILDPFAGEELTDF